MKILIATLIIILFCSLSIYDNTAENVIKLKNPKINNTCSYEELKVYNKMLYTDIVCIFGLPNVIEHNEDLILYVYDSILLYISVYDMRVEYYITNGEKNIK